MNSISSKIIVVLGVSAALAAPPAAFAQHGADDGTASGGDHATEVETHQSFPVTRTETYDLRGTVVSDDPASSTVVIAVTKSNHGRRGRALVGQNLTLDVSDARVRVADVNGDGSADLSDVAAGDRVEARVQLPRSGALPSQPVHAQRFRDRGAR